MPSAALLIAALLLVSTRTPVIRDSLARGTGSRSLGLNEFVIDTGMARVRVGQSQPSVAFDGTNYLVVWLDERGATGSDIYGDRVDSTGRVLDPKGLAVCTAPGTQSCPSAAFLDSVCLVVWKDGRSDNSGDVYGTRVTRSGLVLDPADIVVCDAQGAQESSEVAAGDTCWLVVWQDNRAGWKIRAARVGRSGTVLDPGGFLVGAADSSQTCPAVAYDGEDFLVVWQSAQYGPWTLRGARVTNSGQVLDPGGFPISGDISQNMQPVAPSVASTSGDFIVVWQNALTPKYIFAKHISHDGIPDDSTLSLPQAGMPQRNPSVSACGSTYLAAWEEQRGSVWYVYGARVSAAGALLDTDAIPLDSAGSSQPAVAGGTDKWLTVWSDNRLDPNQPDIFGAALDTTGVIAETSFRVSEPATFYCAQHAPAIASHDSGYIAVWESKAQIGGSGSNTNVCGARLDKDGRMIDTLAISIASRAGVQFSPAVACGDSNCLVAWYCGGVYATRLGYDGTILDPGWIAISTSGEAPAVAFDGTNYLVAWSESKNIYGARVSQSGVVLDRINVATTSDTETNPAVAFDGENYLVVWQRRAISYQDDIWGARVSPNGIVLDPNGILIGPGPSMQEGPSVTFGAGNYLVVWHSRNDWRIYGHMVNRAGTLVGPEPLEVSGWEDYYNDDWFPSVAFDGSNYVVTWLAENYSGILEYDVNGAVVDTQGIVTDTFRLSRSGCTEQGPASATGPDGRVLCVYSAIRDPNGNGRDTIPRIWGSFVSSSGALAEPHALTSGRITLAASPNPFGRGTCLRFGRKLVGPDAQVTICDAAGRCVRRLNVRGCAAINWDATDSRGLLLPRGIYFCTLRTGDVTAKLKLIKVG